MKISYNWLRAYLPVKLSPERMAEILTQTGLEVEGVHKTEAVPGGLKGLVIGQVETCEKHPGADRLNVTTVNVGAESPLQIVCGAPNVAAGQKVVVATVGTMLYPSEGDPFKIKKGKIRGEVSMGMICAEDEIGLGKGHDGILVLDPATPVGLPAAEHFDLSDDYTLEIGLTPNRTDGMAHVGVARDLQAALAHMADVDETADCQLTWPDVSAFREGTTKGIEVEVKDLERCPRYCGVTLEGLTVADSPDWLKERLTSIGLAPINNVVDVTNFVLHELGQPLHAFDADHIKGGKVVVQTQPTDTLFVTLDDAERKLSNEDLMICDAEDNGLCLAGVFGGANSGVTASTTRVFLESAYFQPVSVRKSAKRHTLSTDASFRFERGVDPNNTRYALERAALLLMEVAGGQVASNVHDTRPTPVEALEVPLFKSHLTRLVGMELANDTILGILKSLDIDIADTTKDGWTVLVPPYRADVTREADVIEEVLRIYGFNNVPFPDKLNASLSYSPKPDVEKVQNRMSDALVARGFVEIMSNSLTKASYAETFLEGAPERTGTQPVVMLNPLSSDLGAMRESLVFNGLEAIERNQNHRSPDLRLFEFGKTYFKVEGGYQERRRLNLYLTGRRRPESWNPANTDDTVSFTDLKAEATYLLNKLGINRPSGTEALQHPLWAEGLEISVQRKPLLRMGRLSDALHKHFDLRQPVYCAELDWDVVIGVLSMNKIQAQPLAKFPAVRRDLSLLLDTTATFAELERSAKKAEKKLLKNVDLFDVYEGKNLPEGKKSYALSFVLQDAEKTLSDKHIDKVMSAIQRALENDCGAQLR